MKLISKISFPTASISSSRAAAISIIGIVVGLAMAATASAGTSGEEFKGLFDLLTGWMNGYLARSVALAASIAGALYGLAKQNPLLATVGIVFAVILSVGPAVINGILSAVV
jgi:conjugal transfer pilus assembly protein TraA